VKWPFGKKRRAGEEPAKVSPLVRLMQEARTEVEAQAAEQPGWFAALPYRGAMSRDQALEFEIEKRALWRRLIQEAGARPEIRALVWTTRRDGLVCPECQAQDGRRFAKEELAALAALPVHLGCRCELVAER
jgi:hypothetical protein